MGWLNAFAVLLSFASAFLATALALVIWQRHSAGWARSLTLVLLAVSEWALCYAMELSAANAAEKLLWARLQYIGITLTPVAWFAFAAKYAGKERWLSPLPRRLLYLLPLATMILVFSNERHGLIWQEINLRQSEGTLNLLEFSYGSWFWLHLAYSYLLVLGGSYYFLQAAWHARAEYRRYTLLLFIGSVIPWLGNIFYIFGLSPLPQLDLTPLAFAAGTIVLASAVLRHQVFDLVPVAHQTVLTSMPDGVVVVNNQDRIVDINPAAESIMGSSAEDVIGHRLVEVTPEWADLWYSAMTGEEVEEEVEIAVEGGSQFYELRISPVYAGRRTVTGHLITLRNITEHKRTEAELITRQHLFENLVAVARATSEGPTLQATLQNALDVASNLTAAEYGSLFLLDSQGRVSHSILARGKTPPGPRRKIVGSVMDKGLAGWVLRRRTSALVEDTVEDNRWITLPDQPYAVRSVLAVPITSGNEVPGILTLQHSEPHHFDAEDEILLQAASDQMALALRNAQIYEDQRRLADRQLTLYESLRTIGEHLEPATVMHLAVDTIARMTGWPALAILVPATDEQTLVVEAAAGLLQEVENRAFPAAEGICGQVFASGNTKNLSGPRDVATDIAEFPQHESAIFVPLRHGQQRLGVFVVQSNEAAAFNEDDVRLAESLAEAVALAVANARLFQAVADEHSRLQALIQSSRDGIILIGTNWRILVINQTALSYLGLPGEPEDWMYRSLTDALVKLRHDSPETVQMAFSEMRRSTAGDEDGGEGQFEIGSRAIRWLNLPVRTGDTALGRLVVLEDITQDLALQRMRDDLTHTMVHDLRNPLNIVSGSLQMLNDYLSDSSSSDIDQMLNIALQSTQRMLNLVNGILNISRLESGHVPLKREALNVASLVEEVVEAQLPLAREKQLRLETDTADCKRLVEADLELIERVIQNLVGNAIKFTPPEGTVRVALEEGEFFLRVAVSDTGPGVPAEIQEQLFEKFVTGKQRERGSGLGLAFCRMAIEAHGGQIWLESTIGEGATFYFTLPYSADGRDEPALIENDYGVT